MFRKKKEKESRYIFPPADVDLPDDSDLVHVEEDPVSSASLYLVSGVTKLPDLRVLHTRKLPTMVIRTVDRLSSWPRRPLRRRLLQRRKMKGK